MPVSQEEQAVLRGRVWEEWDVRDSRVGHPGGQLAAEVVPAYSGVGAPELLCVVQALQVSELVEARAREVSRDVRVAEGEYYRGQLAEADDLQAFVLPEGPGVAAQ